MFRALLVKPGQSLISKIAGPPLGVLQIAAVLRERFGREVAITALDMDAEGLDLRWLDQHLAAHRYDVVGVSALNAEAPNARAIAEAVKAHAPRTLTVLGGPHPHRRIEEILGHTRFDWAIDGEGERVFPAALERHLGGGELGTDLPGLGYRRADGTVHVPAGTDTITDLDALPYPAWDLIDFDRYARLTNINSMLKGRRYASLFTSRGCPYRCNYCHDVFGKKFRHRSAEHVLGEIDWLHERFGVDELHVVDDIFNLHRPRLKKIMAGLASRYGGRVHVAIPGGLRADILDEPVLDALRQGGTYSLSVAIESASPRIQKLVDKNLDLAKTLWAIEQADRRGMMVRGFFMLGFPTETREEIESTVRLALGSRLTFGYFFTPSPQKGTPFHEFAERVDAAALAALPETSDYHNAESWYERAYGYPLGTLIRWSYVRFYFHPRRLARIVRRAPPRSLLNGLLQMVSLVTNTPYGFRASRRAPEHVPAALANPLLAS
ncbi:MAG: B12-binding domain-containing radical SAM protein [Deltaproteobacteria bacterium]|nr:B12-binding domain-containing radical SAM protein [Deltaproteobacteria bacterium]